MNNSLKIGVMVLLCCFVSCTQNRFYSPNKITEVEFPESFDSISCDTIGIHLSDDLFSIRSYKDLIVFFSYSSPLVHVINAKNDSLISEFGKIGHSKVEFETTPYMCYFRKNIKGDLIMCLPEFHSTKCINLTSTILHSKCILERNVKHIHNNAEITTFWLSDNERIEYKRYGFEGDARDDIKTASNVSIYKNDVRKSFSVYPSLLSFDNGIDETLYMAAFDVSPNMAKCIEIPLFQDRFTIFDIKNGTSVGVKSKKENDDNFESLVSLNSEEANQKLKVQTYNYCLSEPYIFIWHNGKTSLSEENAEEKMQINPEIRVFDWNGKFMASFILKGKLLCIAYNEVANKIYAIDINGNVVRYDLSKILQ
ncbi:MAG: hypothetical protein MJZ20_03255 [Bacteroidaceae bacterium]|nr:hypothetical protein [Bacteroidaceae bacterium]